MARSAARKGGDGGARGRKPGGRQTAPRAAKAPAAAKGAGPRGRSPERAGPARRGPPTSAAVDFSRLDLRDALDLAILIEEEAQERYERLSSMVGGRYAGDAGDVFRSMAKNEALHGAQLREQREELFAGVPRRIGADALYDVEAPDFGKAGVFMSARQALEAALESEVKAHEFFAQAVPHVTDAAVRRLFEELAAEELKHQAQLRVRMRGLPGGPDLDADLADPPGSDPG